MPRRSSIYLLTRCRLDTVFGSVSTEPYTAVYRHRDRNIKLGSVRYTLSDTHPNMRVFHIIELELEMPMISYAADAVLARPPFLMVMGLFFDATRR